MKRITILIISISIAANIALCLAILRGGSATAAGEPATKGAAATAVATTHPASDRAAGSAGDKLLAAAAAAGSAPATPHKKIRWADVYSPDMRTLAANLRALGLSERMVFTIVAGLVHQQTWDKIRALRSADGVQPFWKTGSPMQVALEQRKQFEAALRDQRDLMTDLFGTNAVNENDRIQWEQRYGPLPLEKLQKIDALNSDYAMKLAESAAYTPGPSMPWDREARAAVEQQKRKDIEALLTPEELQTYDLYSSMTANTLRRNLANFSPTESEFRAIYDLQKAFDDKYSYAAMSAAGTSQDLMRERMSAQRDMNSQIEATLGPARYADYQRSTDRGYQTAVSIGQRLNLPAENATAVYALQQDIQQRAAAARSLPGDQFPSALHDLATEANAKLTSLLTAEGAEAYKNGGGQWVRTLEQRSRVMMNLTPKQ